MFPTKTAGQISQRLGIRVLLANLDGDAGMGDPATQRHSRRCLGGEARFR